MWMALIRPMLLTWYLLFFPRIGKSFQISSIIRVIRVIRVRFCPLPYGAIPFVGIAQICLTACLHVALGLSAFLRRDSA